MSPYQPVIFSKRPDVPSIRDTPTDREREVLMGASEISLLVTVVSCVAISYAMPFRSVKYGMIAFFAVLFLVQTMKRPALGLALLAFGTPAIDLVPKDLIPIRGVNAETMLIVALIFILQRAYALEGKEEIRTRMGRTLVAYALLIIISCFNAYLTWRFSLFDLLASAKNHLSYMLFLPVTFHVARTRRDQALVVTASMVSLFINCIQAIDYSWIAFFAGTLERYRAYALLAIQPNLFGAALSFYLPFVVLRASKSTDSRGARLWYLVLAGAVGFALILTLSRGGVDRSGGRARAR
ncbi:MAG: hypothetical protein HC882_09595, partial [Acidobacteria bacterium]|nr:hypothetical protein [Acidobacteriota bacterium]